MMRSGEAMELALRDCCQSIRIGKLLIKRKNPDEEPTVFYAKLPPDAHERAVFLMHPLLDTGASLLKAVALLKERRVPESSIIILNLFSTDEGIRSILDVHPDVRILTTEIGTACPSHFGQIYFGAR
ncbi:uracil phosphoribosyltransferase homolog [Sycon ciliatum]